MSFNPKDNLTTTLQRPTTEKDFADLVDKKVEQNINLNRVLDEVERETARFETSHTAAGLAKVYDKIDRQTIATADEAELESDAVEDYQDVSETEPAHESSVDRVKRSKSYHDVVRTFETPTIQLDEVAVSKKVKKTSQKAKKSSNRMKLWIVTGACCLVLLVGLVVCNALAIGSIERQTGLTESALVQQERELEGINGQITAEEGVIPENMRDIVHNGGTIDITPTVSTEIVTTDNFFNRFAKFIAYLFGR